MKIIRSIIITAVLSLSHCIALADCSSIYEWQAFQSFGQIEQQVDPLSRDSHDQKELFDAETCLKEEADNLNNWWTTRHFEFVEKINQTQKTITRVEKLEIEIKQIKEEIEIQKQAIQSLKLIYQSKLLEIPKAYLLVAKKRVDVGAVQKEIERKLHDACLRFLQIRFTDHHIRSETKVKNYKVVSDFIEDFQGGRAQSFEFDPVVYQDENEILHYVQVYRLYPLFPVARKSSVKRLLDSAVDNQERKLSKYISNLSTLNAPDILPIIKKQHETQLNNMIQRVQQINYGSISALANINKSYFSKVSNEEKNLTQLENELKGVARKISGLPATQTLREQLRLYHSELNKHVNNREIIVVTNPSELSHSGTAVTDQYMIILKQAYKSLIDRARESKAYKFYRVENGRLTEADANTFYSSVEPVQYVMPFFRKTHRKAEGVWRIGIVIGLRVRLSHGKSSEAIYHDKIYHSKKEGDLSKRPIIWLFVLLFVCLVSTIYILVGYQKHKLHEKQSQKKILSNLPIPPDKNSLKKKPNTLVPKNITNSINMKLVYIPPGSFLMGSPLDEPERKPEERQHKVTLTKGFYMGATVVTLGQWRKFIQDSGYQTEAELRGYSIIQVDSNWVKQKGAFWDSPGFSQNDDHPITCVSWNDAQKFIKWLSEKEGTTYSLPTEAQWEYGCKVGTDTPFSFGAVLSTDQANYDGRDYIQEGLKGEYIQKTTPVTHFEPNSWGLYDMYGNVWEWCHDWYGDYPKGSVIDPIGLTTGSRRVDRGGSWDSKQWACRSSYRGVSPPDESSSIIGFRVVRQI